MSVKYHVNNDGKVGRCFAKKVCRFGSSSVHFNSKEDAIEHATSMLEEKYGTSVKMKVTSGKNKEYSQNKNTSIRDGRKTLKETAINAKGIIEKLSTYDTNLLDNKKVKFSLMRCDGYFKMATESLTQISNTNRRLTLANGLRDNLRVAVQETIKSNLRYCDNFVKDPNNTDHDKKEEIKYHQQNYNDIAESLLELGIKMKPLNIGKIIRNS